MRTASPGDRRVGVVRTFDAHVGLGVIVDGDEEFVVHCTRIDGGARTIAPGTPVSFDTAAGHRGRWDAVDVRSGIEGTFLCPVCATPVAGGPGDYEICPACGWEDDPVSRDDPNATGGANAMSLTEARRAWR